MGAQTSLQLMYNSKSVVCHCLTFLAFFSILLVLLMWYSVSYSILISKFNILAKWGASFGWNLTCSDMKAQKICTHSVTSIFSTGIYFDGASSSRPNKKGTLCCHLLIEKSRNSKLQTCSASLTVRVYDKGLTAKLFLPVRLLIWCLHCMLGLLTFWH